MTIEVTEVRCRPIKPAAEVFALISLILMIISIAGSEWVQLKYDISDEKRSVWSLWKNCIFNTDESCSEETLEDWQKACGGLSVIGLILIFVSLISGGIGLFLSRNQENPRRIQYIVAGVLLVCAALAMFLTLIIYPIMTNNKATDNKQQDRYKRWEFDWAYGMGWGSFFFIVAAAVFFFIPIENQRQERKYYQ